MSRFREADEGQTTRLREDPFGAPDEIQITNGGEEAFAVTHTDFLQGFEAVGKEGGTDDQHALDAALGEFEYDVITVGIEPGIAVEAGLEGDGVFLFWQKVN